MENLTAVLKVADMFRTGGDKEYIPAIKYYRYLTGCTLREAKLAVDDIASQCGFKFGKYRDTDNTIQKEAEKNEEVDTLRLKSITQCIIEDKEYQIKALNEQVSTLWRNMVEKDNQIKTLKDEITRLLATNAKLDDEVVKLRTGITRLFNSLSMF